MTPPGLQDLPAPPAGRTGWPWTEASAQMPAVMPDGSECPRITVVTPSFNQERFLEATLRSILLQGYPNLEYFVMDGGSTDGSVEIIRKYARWLTAWVSKPDGGQSAAILAGLRLGSGAFATWINSDDMLERSALVNQAVQVGFEPRTVYVGDCLYINERDEPQFVHRARVHSLEDLVRVRTVWRAPGRRGHIVQPEVLFPRELALAVGGVDPHNHRTMDYELWGRLFMAGVSFRYTHIRFGVFRVHGDQKTSQGWATTQSLIATASKLATEAAGLDGRIRGEILADLLAYKLDYWRESGPLARLGLPEGLVLSLRDFRAVLRRRAIGVLRRAPGTQVLL